MKGFLVVVAVAALLSACGGKEDACDPTGNRYSEMMRAGTPLTEKDKACLQAIWIKQADESVKALKDNIPQVKTAPPIKWSETFSKKEKDKN